MTKRLYLVRHARAGDRDRWTESDRLRPLTALGERQARALVRPLRTAGIRRLVSSPFARCVETVRPFSEIAGVELERDRALAEGASYRAVRGLIARLPGGSALCTHGDVIAGLLEAAVCDGVELAGRPRLAKASIWVLDLGRCGRIVRARYRPPPVIE